MTNNDENVLAIDLFINLLSATQDSSNFKSYKASFLHSLYLSIRHKERHV